MHCWKRGNKWGIQPLLPLFPNHQSSPFSLTLLSYILLNQWFLLFQVLHYVEKPSTFVSDIINCGIYLFNPDIFQHIGAVFQKNQQDMLLWVEALFLRGSTHVCQCHWFYFSGSPHLSFFLLLMIFVSSHNHQISIWWVSWFVWAARHSWRALSEWCEL